MPSRKGCPGSRRPSSSPTVLARGTASWTRSKGPVSSQRADRFFVTAVLTHTGITRTVLYNYFPSRHILLPALRNDTVFMERFRRELPSKIFCAPKSSTFVRLPGEDLFTHSWLSSRKPAPTPTPTLIIRFTPPGRRMYRPKPSTPSVPNPARRTTGDDPQ